MDDLLVHGFPTSRNSHLSTQRCSHPILGGQGVSSGVLLAAQTVCQHYVFERHSHTRSFRATGRNWIKIGLRENWFSVREKVFGKSYSLENSLRESIFPEDLFLYNWLQTAVTADPYLCHGLSRVRPKPISSEIFCRISDRIFCQNQIASNWHYAIGTILHEIFCNLQSIWHSAEYSVSAESYILGFGRSLGLSDPKVPPDLPMIKIKNCKKELRDSVLAKVQKLYGNKNW